MLRGAEICQPGQEVETFWRFQALEPQEEEEEKKQH